MSKTLFSTFDIEKIKKLRGQPSGANDSSVEWYSNHNQNRDTSRTADPSKMHLNVHKGNAVERIDALWSEVSQKREELGLRKMRKDSVKGVEVMLGASQEFFKKNKKGEWQVDKDWVNASKNWAISHYQGKGKLVQLDLTRDERGGPKLKMIFAPVNDETNSFNAGKFVGNKADIKKAQTSYASMMQKEFGLTPPTKGSKIKNNKKVDSDISEESRIANHEARVAENERLESERMVRELYSEFETLRSEVDALRDEKDTLKIENKELAADNREKGISLKQIVFAFDDIKYKLNNIKTGFFDIIESLTPKHGSIEEKLNNADSNDLDKLKEIVIASLSALENTDKAITAIREETPANNKIEESLPPKI